MARKTYASFTKVGNSRGVYQTIATALATLASGKNDDATNYDLPNVAATPTALATLTTDVQGVAAAAGLVLMGYAARETAGTPAVATLILRHGTLATDPIIVPIELAANGTDKAWFGPNGIALASGIFVDRVAGESEITLFTKTIT